jgi:hypothetical protein
MKKMLLVAMLGMYMSMLGCSNLTGIPLVWKPTSDPYGENTGSYATFPGQRFKIVPFTDNRENKTEIARNVESSTPKLVTTKDDVSKWCTDRFKDSLELYGFKLVESGETIQLHGEVVQFHVLEDTRYKSTVGFKISALTADNKLLWQGLVTGSAKRFGKSYSQENYYETLSDAYLVAVQNFIRDEDFVKALRTLK